MAREDQIIVKTDVGHCSGPRAPSGKPLLKHRWMSLALAVLAGAALVGCMGPAPTPDPTKPVPWNQDPETGSDDVGDGVTDGDEADADLDARQGWGALGDASDSCAIPSGYAAALLVDVTADPASFENQAIQIAGFVERSARLTAQLCLPEFPDCNCILTAALTTEPVSEEPTEEEEWASIQGIGIRDSAPTHMNGCVIDPVIPEVDVGVAWGRVKTQDGVASFVLDGFCNGDAIPCEDGAACPAALECSDRKNVFLGPVCSMP